MAFAWTRASAGPSFPSDAFTHSTYSSSETNALSKAGLVGFRPRDSLPKPCLLACLLHSLKVDSLFGHWVLREHGNSGSHSSFMAWKSKYMSVPTPYKTNMRKCMHNSQGKEGLLTIQHLKNGHHSLLVFNTPACSHILSPSRLILDHGLQLLNQGIWKLNIYWFVALLCQPHLGRPFLPQFLHARIFYLVDIDHLRRFLTCICIITATAVIRNRASKAFCNSCFVLLVRRRLLALNAFLSEPAFG